MDKIISRKSNKLNLQFLALLIALILYFIFGFSHLAKFETADEHFWIDNDRIHDYWSAVSDGDWKKTRINDKPGITLAYVSGIGMLFDSEHNRRVIEDEKIFDRYDPAVSEKIDFCYRLPLLIFNGLFAIYFFWIIRKLTKKDFLAAAFSILILLNPILLGISQIVNPDALFWVFSAAAIFTYLAYLDNDEKELVFLSTLFLGLTLATKYVGLILIPFFSFAFIGSLFFIKNDDKGLLSQKIRNVAIANLLIIAGSVLIFSILMPAVFVKHKYLTDGLIGFGHLGYVFWSVVFFNILLILESYFLKNSASLFIIDKFSFFKNHILKVVVALLLALICLVLVNWISDLNLFGLNAVSFDAKQSDFYNSLPFYSQYFLQLKPMVFSLPPLILLLLIFVLGKTLFDKIESAYLVFVLSSFILIYYFAVTIQGLLVNVRYGIMLYPLVIFLAATGLDELLSLSFFKKIKTVWIYLGLIIISLCSLWMIKPFYFNYANLFLPKHELISGAWGYGGHEAAEFIDSLPGSENFTIISDYSGVCSFAKGRCAEFSNDVKKKLIEDLNQNISNENYFYVLTRRGQIRWGYLNQFARFKNTKPLWRYDIGGRPENFIEVYGTKQLMK